MWYLSIRISHCFVVNPVNENIPIWLVMWSHVPGVFILSSSSLNNFRILMILLATSSFNYFCHSAKFCLSLRILATIRAPCIGGLEYIFLAIILFMKEKILYLWKNFLFGTFTWGNYMKSANSLAIKTCVFGKWLGNYHLKSLWNEVPDWPGVFLKISSCETLISRIEEWHQGVLFHNGTDFFPLFLSWVDTSWIMGAGM